MVKNKRIVIQIGDFLLPIIGFGYSFAVSLNAPQIGKALSFDYCSFIMSFYQQEKMVLH